MVGGALLVALWWPPLASHSLESSSALQFEDDAYVYTLAIDGAPLCPNLVELFYSMSTMRELTSFVDTVEMVSSTPTSQQVRVTFSVLGSQGWLLYERAIDRAAGTMTMTLLSYENDFEILPYPVQFRAQYAVSHTSSATRVDYRQDAITSKRLSLLYRFFVRQQMHAFARKLHRILARECR